MKPFLFIFIVLCAATALADEPVRLTDGTHIDVVGFEVRDDVVVLVTTDGKLRSVPLSSVDLATLPDQNAMIAEAIELMGLRRLTDEISKSARMAAAGLDGGALTSELVADAMAQGFRAERLYEVAEEAFRQRASGLQLAAALRFLRSPIARRIEDAERGGSEETLARYTHELASAPPTRERVELLLRLDRASGTSDAAVEMQAAMLKALLQGLYPSGPDVRRTIEDALDEARPRLARKTRARIQVSLHFMYRDLGDDELSEYVSFLESENGEWLSRVMLKSLFAAMEHGARRSGEVLAKRLKEQSKLKA
jgi:hypothetical protein